MISVPAAAVPAAIDDCVAKGVKGVVVITAGFGETGEEGRRREAALLEKVRDAGMRMVGPNCMGLVNTNPAVRLNATFAPDVPARGPRGAVVAERGARPRAARLRRAAEPRDLDLRLRRQQGRRLVQRPRAVLGRGSADRRDPALPRKLRKPGRLLPHRAPRRPAQADRRRQGRALARGRARRVFPHRRARRERHASSTPSSARPASSGPARSRSSSTSPRCSRTSPCRAAAASRS